MTACEFCSIIHGEFASEEIYQDDEVMAVLHLKPAAPGQVLLFTKEHYSISEQVPDFVMGRVFSVLNKISIAIFEALGVQGTNIIIENGTAAGQSIPHFSASIIPRRENDGLDLQWQPKKVGSEEMDVAHFQLKEQAESIHPSMFEHKKKIVVGEKAHKAHEDHEKPAEHPKKHAKAEEDYRLRQLRRIP